MEITPAQAPSQEHWMHRAAQLSKISFLALPIKKLSLSSLWAIIVKNFGISGHSEQVRPGGTLSPMFMHTVY